MNDLEQYLRPGFFTDSNHPEVIAYTQKKISGIVGVKEKVIALYNSVRDDFIYNPYHINLKPYAMKASFLLTKKYGYCVEKSNLFAACVRSMGIPSRTGYSNVRNHLGTQNIEKFLKTDLLVFHGYAEIFLNNKWIKSTPVFNMELCHKYGVEPLLFDGENDAIFQESDKKGNPFMEYIYEHGTYADVPVKKFEVEMRRHYPHLFTKQNNTTKFFLEFED
ncbi:MAG: transglutaminase family protein [Saprospiraceae bacterium]|nr:transglutaminase family protein [Saprospiraceae bacterium]